MIKQGLSPRLAQIGHIKIGGKGEIRKAKSGKDYRLPVKYDHFIVTTTEKGSDDNYIIDGEIMRQLGKEPKEIPILLIFDDIDMNFYTSFQLYKGSKLQCKGDGERATWYGENKEEKSIKCDPSVCKYAQPDEKGATKCKISGILSCMLKAASDLGAVYRFRTHSWNSVSNILASLRFIADNTGGVLMGLPLKMKMLKKSTQEHGNVNTVTIVLDGIEMRQMRDLALSEYKNRKMLKINMKEIEDQATASGFLVDTDNPLDIAEEFYPPVELQNVTPEPEPKDEQPGTSTEQVKKELEKKPFEEPKKEELGLF